MRRFTLALVGALTLLIGAAAGGHAAASAAGPAPMRGATCSDTNCWTGLVLQGSGPYSAVGANWRNPSIDCRPGGTRSSVAFWVGLDGWNTPTLEQTGVETSCTGGTPSYQAWYEWVPAPQHIIPFTVQAGDAMYAQVVNDGGGWFTSTLIDHTRNWTFVHHAHSGLNGGNADGHTAEIVAEAPTVGHNITPLADFGSVTFTTVNVDRRPVSSFGYSAVNTYDSENRLKASTGQVFGADRRSFTVTWHRSL